jgi:iron complex transport system ATP-binding protein
VSLATGRRRSDQHVVLQGVDLQLQKGRWYSVLGPNGAGKTTLLRAIAGLLDAGDICSGEVTLAGRALTAWPQRERAQKMAWLGSAAADVDGHLSGLRAWDIVALGRLPHQRWWPATAPLTTEDEAVIERVMMQTHTWQWRTRPIQQLSSGERQRVMVARALAVDADIILMDEPLLNLDPPHQSEWLQIVRNLVQQGRTVVSVLHELNMALYADTLLLFAEGRLVHDGPIADAATQVALCRIFSNRITLRQIDDHWVALPRL